MIVNRTVFINPVEPEFLAFRISSGIETKIDFHFKAQNGAPHNEDMVCQLQMTARSRDQVEYISVPSTDVVNGKARAIIPAGLAYDPNGWRLRLTGTVDQEPRVIAYGVASAVAGAGPQAEPQDVIDTIPLSFQRDEEVNLNVTLWADASKSSVYDLTARGTSVSGYIFNHQGGNVLVQFSTTPISSNIINLYLTPLQVNDLPDACWWTLVATTAAGLTTLCEGPVAVSGVVKPPFADTTVNWVYLTEDAVRAPVPGEALHANYAFDFIRFNQYDADGGDREGVLNQLLIGDQILLDITTWSITAISKPGPDWYQIHVEPAAQGAVTGLNPFTFHRA